MKDRKKPLRKWKIAAAAAAGIIILLSVIRLAKLREETPASDLSRYDYRDTRHLVALTGRAAALVGKEGKRAFAAFRKNPGKWSLHNSGSIIRGRTIATCCIARDYL